MKRDRRFWLFAVLALVFEASAVVLAVVQGWLFVAVLSHLVAGFACWRAADVSDVYRDMMLVGALVVPVLGPVAALMLFVPSERSAMNAHAFFENYETEVGVRAQLLRPEKDASNITMSFQEVLHHGSIDHRRNALRKLAERGQPLHLAMLRRCLSHPDMELRLGAFSEVNRMLRTWEKRISTLVTDHEASPGCALAVRLSAARRSYATSGLLDREMSEMQLHLALACCANARATDPNEPTIAIEEAKVCLALGDLAGAERAVARVREEDSELPELCIVRAKVAFESRRFETIDLEVDRLKAGEADVPFWMRSLSALHKEDWEREEDWEVVS